MNKLDLLPLRASKHENVQEIEWAHHMAWGRSFSWENFLSLCPTRGGNPAATSWKNDYKERPNLSLTFRLPNRQFRGIVQYNRSFCIMSLLRNKMQTVSDSTINKINHFNNRVGAIHKVSWTILGGEGVDLMNNTSENPKNFRS